MAKTSRATKQSFARVTKKPIKVRKKYPFATTQKGQSFVEEDLNQWARLRVSASRYNAKNGTNFIVQKDGNVLRCGEPE